MLLLLKLEMIGLHAMAQEEFDAERAKCIWQQEKAAAADATTERLQTQLLAASGKATKAEAQTQVCKLPFSSFDTVTSLCNDCFGSHKSCLYQLQTFLFRIEEPLQSECTDQLQIALSLH